MEAHRRDDPLSGVTASLFDYAAAVDEGRVDDFVSLFTADAVFYRNDVVGHDAIRRLTIEMLRDYSATSHHISNVRIIETTDDEVASICQVYAWHRHVDGHDVEVWGQYRSRFRYEDGRWRFVRHTARAAGVRPEGALGQVARVPRSTIDRDRDLPGAQ
jgi:3-phenylpropionate/cinnamic acid dioxygenase small subunit